MTEGELQAIRDRNASLLEFIEAQRLAFAEAKWWREEWWREEWWREDAAGIVAAEDCQALLADNDTLLAEVDALKAESGRVAANYQDWPTLLVACSRCRRVIPVAEETGKVVNSPAYCSRHDCK
jgi:hypothetical protein